MNDPQLNQGGPAFPRIEPPSGGEGARIFFGMSMRDYAAVNIMAGLSSNPAIFQQSARCGFELANCTFEQLSDLAVNLADSLIKEARK